MRSVWSSWSAPSRRRVVALLVAGAILVLATVMARERFGPRLLVWRLRSLGRLVPHPMSPEFVELNADGSPVHSQDARIEFESIQRELFQARAASLDPLFDAYRQEGVLYTRVHLGNLIHSILLSGREELGWEIDVHSRQIVSPADVSKWNEWWDETRK